MEIKERIIEVCNCRVEVVTYSYGSFYYPCFNSNAEFKVNSKGFRELSRYIRTVRYFRLYKNGKIF